jgi:hypothetical protein
MMHRPCVPFFIALLLCLAAQAQAAAAWLAKFEQTMADPGAAPAALEMLRALPQGAKQTSDYHWALARAYQAADQPSAAAEAVATYGILPPNPPRDLTPIKNWLSERSNTLYSRATESIHAGDGKTGIKSFLQAVKCDPAVLVKDNAGVGDASLQALKRLVEKRPEKNDYRFQLGFISYLYGKSDVCEQALRAYIPREKDPYKAWRAHTWLGRIRWELASIKAAEEGRVLKPKRVKELKAERAAKDLDADGVQRTERKAAAAHVSATAAKDTPADSDLGQMH